MYLYADQLVYIAAGHLITSTMLGSVITFGDLRIPHLTTFSLANKLQNVART